MEYTVNVQHNGRSFNAGVQPQEKADQLMLRALNHFDIDTGDKGEWTLVRGDSRLVLDRSIAGQLDSGDTVELRPRDADSRQPSTGSY